MIRNLRLSVSVVALILAAEAVAVLSRTQPPAESRGEHAMASLAIPETAKRIFHRSCKDCHSTETSWPWYSRIEPIAALIRHDVAAGRQHLDFSAWGRDPARPIPSHNELEDICDAISKRSMPPPRYLLMHSNARLTPDEVKTICDLADSLP